MTPIEYGHTQLTSTIALWAPGQCPRPTQSSPAVAGPGYPLDWLGPVPSLFARVHRPEILERMVLRMRAALLNPVQVEWRGSYRRVQILQTTIIEFRSRGELSAYAWESVRGIRLVPVPRPLSYVSAEGRGHEGRWCSGFAQGLLVELRGHHYRRRQLSKVQAVLPTYVLWVIDRVKTHLQETLPQAPVHAAIEQALQCAPNVERRYYAQLGLEADVLSRARVLARFTRHLGSDTPSLKDYQECLPCLQKSA